MLWFYRWQSSLQMQAGRCAGCLGSIPFARNAARCQECGVTAHNKVQVYCTYMKLTIRKQYLIFCACFITIPILYCIWD